LVDTSPLPSSRPPGHPLISFSLTHTSLSPSQTLSHSPSLSPRAGPTLEDLLREEEEERRIEEARKEIESIHRGQEEEDEEAAAAARLDKMLEDEE